MLAIDQCLGKSTDVEFTALFDERRGELTHFGKLTRKSVPHYISWIMGLLLSSGVLKQYVLTQYDFLNVLFNRIIYMQTQGAVDEREYAEVVMEIEYYLRAVRFMVLHTRSASLTEDSVANTKYFINDYLAGISEINPKNIHGRMRWMLDIFLCLLQLQFLPAATYAQYTLSNNLAYSEQRGGIKRDTIILSVIAHATVMDIPEAEHLQMVRDSASVAQVTQSIGQSIASREKISFDWIDL